MSYEKSAGYYDHNRDFAPPSEPPPSYDGAPHQPSYPAQQDPIPYPNQQPSTWYPAPQGPPYPAPQGPPYPKSSSAPAPPPGRNFVPFETITVPTLRYRLSDGFSPDLPQSYEQPHPFASHDVTQKDWLAFLEDIQRITRNTSEERLREIFGAESSSVAGLGSGGRGGLARGLLGAIAEGVSKSMSGGASKAAQEPVSLLIAEWNRDFWTRRNIEVSLVLEHVSPDPYGNANTPPSQACGRGLRTSRSPRRDCGRSEKRAEKRAERSAFKTELIADVHHMLGAKETSAAYRAAADEGRYGTQPGWCLVLRYKGPAPASYAGGAGSSGWATRP